MSGVRGSFSISTLFIVALVSCGSDDGGVGNIAPNSLTQCVADKLGATATYCGVLFDAGSNQADIDGARAELGAAWNAAEAEARADGLSCSDQALTAEQASEKLERARVGIVADAVDSGASDGAVCVANLIDAAGTMCRDQLQAERDYIVDLLNGAAPANLAARRESARREFLPRGDAALGTTCIAASVDPRMISNFTRARIDRLVDDLAYSTVVAANADNTQFTTQSPIGTVDYEGRALAPVCIDGSPYHFFTKPGTVNKVVMYYQGGGACWEKLTCGVPACDTDVNPEGGDNPNNRSTGFADLDNPNNPFRDWHIVFVSYCGCDIHFGDAAQDYISGPADNDPLHVEHRGFHNAKVVEKWAREHFIAPDEVFVTGSSAGAYGAWFHAPLLHDVWPWAQFHVLADAGNGVITGDFLLDFFPNWNFEANLPEDLPALGEVLEDGSGIPGYTKVVAELYPDTNWAHYTTAFDGGSGGQTGFYNIMLNDNNPINALSWWEGSCSFTTVMREQVLDTSAAVPRNYRYYIGTGSRHTMWGNDKVYGDTTGGVPPIVEWVNAMLDSDGGRRDAKWSNVECEDCGLTLPGDPAPDPLRPPFEMVGDDVVIVCE